MEDPQNGFQAFHTLWTGIITVAGGVVAFFTKRLIDEVDQKADRSELNNLKETVESLLERQDRYHQNNTERLDKIILALSERRQNP